MSSDVPEEADSSVHLLLVPDGHITTLSAPQANDITRLHITPRSMHQDDPVPAIAPGFPVPNPVDVNIDHPPLAMINMAAVGGGYRSSNITCMCLASIIIPDPTKKVTAI